MRKLTGIRYVYWLLILLAIVALTLCVRQLIVTQNAIKAWQAETERLNTKVEQLEIQTESDFYRGMLASCTDIGIDAKVPRMSIVVQCWKRMQKAYNADWFNELKTDTWIWPPDEPVKTLPIKGQVAVRQDG